MVTLAHLARPLALLPVARAEGWSCVLACSSAAHRFLGEKTLDWRPLKSLDAAKFAHRLSCGDPVYTQAELSAYVQSDLELINAVKPDLVVGDFRLSLSVSARLAGVRYAAITNTYWSPWAQDQAVVLPVLPWTAVVPLKLSQAVFQRLHTWFLAPHCRPLNAVRRAHGLPALPADLRAVYTDADDVLCADAPSLFPLRTNPGNHWSIGPVLWSPPVPLPQWWPQLPGELPLIYITMGSSGDPRTLVNVVRALARPQWSLVVATAGAKLPELAQPGVWTADYLPGDRVAARASLVVCNGGSPTSQQAIAAGVPVLGICGNMDQFLNMRGLSQAGLGVALRADRLHVGLVARTALELLEPAVQQLCRQASTHGGPDYRLRFAEFLHSRRL